ncbi:MAG TPA: type II toxin-antitoxin system HicA family toxin [Chromatiales bacterium]|nr:type II toxin-antitoxin system HicA family toxin [Chromatiales bacterium]
MKRSALLRHLRRHGCVLVREGGRHSWWGNPVLNRRSAVPRHSEIADTLARKICKDLGVPPVSR